MFLKTRAVMILIAGVSLLSGTFQAALSMGAGIEVSRISKEEVKAMMGNPDVVILDVRESQSWKDAKWKIQGAVREDPEKDVKSWAEKYPKDKTLILYCS
jgi:predicted sulfurtransferase